ncbi:MAG: hypothetical protein HY423_07450 [Candidatus Lambdaproteobacteria bacterium]|nr:hypothetical protein [Candidatus Lambdaproteobacteria bacterium]
MKIAYLLQNRPEYQHRLIKDIPYVIVAAGPDKRWNADTLAKLADVDAIIVSAEPVTEEVLRAAPRTRIVQRLGVGYENVDLEAAAKRGIPCCNLAGVNKEAVAEHGLMLILALAKNLMLSDQYTRGGRWNDARALTLKSHELKGKTLGIFGLGDTGSNLAKRAKALDMNIIYNDIREIDAKTVETLGARKASKEQLLAEADVVSVNVTFNPTSRNLIDAKALARMKQGAWLVCCARGGIVDEAALADALDSEHLAGAGIDVFSSEPIKPDNPLLKAKNVILTSHVAGVNVEASDRNFQWAHENVRRVLEKKEKPRFIVNGV